MMSIAIKILSILGILFLCLLGLVLLAFLLVLFFPIQYRVTGRKNEKKINLSVRVSWLFGLLRILFDFPDPGNILVKVLPITVFDSGKLFGEGTEDGDKGDKNERKNKAEKKKSVENQSEITASGEGFEKSESSENTDKIGKTSTDQTGQEAELQKEKNDQPGQDNTVSQGQNDRDSQENISKKKGGFFKKFEKIKYTIRNIYDKIKNVWENISYYIELLRDEETKQLFNHAMFRIGKILKSIRPRKIRGNILFGTGAPDTTGYAYGVYGMLSPFIGDKLIVTPDFTQTILEGEIYIAGHITIFTILWNGLKLLLDKKLRRFMKKMKAGRKN